MIDESEDDETGMSEGCGISERDAGRGVGRMLGEMCCLVGGGGGDGKVVGG